MLLTETQLDYYKNEGYLFLPDLFTSEEVSKLISETIPLKVKESPDVIWEEDHANVRALLGCHFKSDTYKSLVQQARILKPAQQLVESDVYVYQFKINLKAAFKGEIWPWHQDFIYWHELDGMPLSRSVNITLFLDDCTEFNGPLWLIPGSHNEGVLKNGNANRDGDWTKDVAADLTFKLDAPAISRLVNQGGIASPKGKAGSVLIFHPNIAHASLPNISPFERKILIVTYNSVKNIPIPKAKIRPNFLVNQDTTPEVITSKPLVPDSMPVLNQ